MGGEHLGCVDTDKSKSGKAPTGGIQSHNLHTPVLNKQSIEVSCALP